LLGHFEQADVLAKRALDIFPHSANALTVEGLLRMNEGKGPEALRIFQEAIRDDPALGVAYLAMGQVYNSQGRFKEALAPLERAAKFLPNEWSVYYETARARLGVGDFQSGLTEITQGERFVGGDSHAKAALSLLHGLAHFHLKDHVRARQYLNQAISSDPKGPYAVYAQNALERLGSFLVANK
jgi:tetratricopeptide (TPR) repeat protein